MLASVLLIFATVFLGIFTLVLAGATAGQSPAARLKSRLRSLAQNDSQLFPGATRDELLQEGTPTAEQFLTQFPLMKRVKRSVERAGLKISPALFVLWVSTAAASSFVVFYLPKRSPLIGLLVALSVVGAAYLFLGFKRRQRELRFTEQLPDVLTMIARSLRAGHSLGGAVELVSEELSEPAGPLFKIAFEQQRLGMRMADSLATLPDKIDSVDLRFFVTIIRINSDTGGNLSEILDKLADTIRSRLQIMRQVQVCTAEGRISGYVLAVIPVAIFAMFYLLRPTYMDVFFTNRTCQMMLGGAALAQVLGFLFIRKIVNIKI